MKQDIVAGLCGVLLTVSTFALMFAHRDAANRAYWLSLVAVAIVALAVGLWWLCNHARCPEETDERLTTEAERV